MPATRKEGSLCKTIRLRVQGRRTSAKMNAREHFEAGDLSAAVDAATEEVKRHPADKSRHAFLSELLCFAGDLQRADLHLDAVVQSQPTDVKYTAVAIRNATQLALSGHTEEDGAPEKKADKKVKKSGKSGRK